MSVIKNLLSQPSTINLNKIRGFGGKSSPTPYECASTSHPLSASSQPNPKNTNNSSNKQFSGQGNLRYLKCNF
jgi:hypothetical protein